MLQIKNYRWLVVAMLLVATTINYIDRQIIGLLKPILEKEFNWTETDFSRIVMAFSGAYAIGLLTMGRFVDKAGTKIGYSVSVAVWSIAGMLHAVVTTVSGFSVVRIILGIGEAGNFPAAMKAVAEWFPKKERGLATGIVNAGASIGVVAALFIAPLILKYWGWKEVFWITGALGFVWLLAWWTLYEIPANQKRISGEELALIQSGEGVESKEADSRPLPWVSLFKMPQTWIVVVGKLFIDPIYWFFLFWLPSYFATTFGLDLTKPSVPLMIIYAATTIGSIGGGYISSRLIRNGWSVLKARITTLGLLACLELSVICVRFITDVWVAVGLLSLAVAAHQAWATNIFTLASDLFPKKSVSSVVGIAGMAGAIGGILFPILVGYLLDTYKLSGNLAGGYHLLFVFCGLTYTLVWLLIRGLSGRIKVQ